MILLIDNYDSFTYNLTHLIGALGREVKVIRNDRIEASEAIALTPEAIVLSPGPCTPNESGVGLDLVRGAVQSETPVFGVCLGMQTIAQALGGAIRRAEKLMHGKTCEVVHEGGWLFQGVPSPFVATRYHSLIVDPQDLPDALTAAAFASGDGELMALSHRVLPIAGVQFHPESIASEYGAELISNFLDRAKQGRLKA